MPTRAMHITRSAALAALGKQYRRIVQDLAEELRPRFESGELHGYQIDEDYEEEHLDKDGADPIVRLREDVKRRHVPDFKTAYIFLACSPSENREIDGSVLLADAQFAAAECVVIDAFRIARRQGWWKPRADEYIGNSDWERLSDRSKAA